MGVRTWSENYGEREKPEASDSEAPLFAVPGGPEAQAKNIELLSSFAHGLESELMRAREQLRNAGINLRDVRAEGEGRVREAEARVRAAEIVRDDAVADALRAREQLEPLSLRIQDLLHTIEIQAAALAATQTESRELVQQIESLTAANGMTQCQHEQALASIELLGNELRDTRGRVDELTARYMHQTDALIEFTRAEARRIASMIDVAQSGRFWRIKHLVSRLLGRSER